MPELRDATVTIGVPGLNGTGITGPEKTTITTTITALTAAKYIVQTADATLTGEQALSSLTTGLVKVTTGTGVLSTASAADLPAHTHTLVGVAPFIIDGGGATITTGIKGDLPPMTFAGTITGWALLGDQTGSISVSGWMADVGSFPPSVGNIIFTATISAATKGPASGGYQAISVPFVVGHVIRVNVNSVTSLQRVTLGLRIERDV